LSINIVFTKLTHSDKETGFFTESAGYNASFRPSNPVSELPCVSPILFRTKNENGCIPVVWLAMRGGISKIVEHGLNGSMLPRQQLKCLGDVVWECLDLDSKVRVQMGMAARERILAEFSPLQEKLLLQSVFLFLLVCH